MQCIYSIFYGQGDTRARPAAALMADFIMLLCEHDKILTFHKCCVNLLRGNFSSLDIINILDLLIMRIYCCTNKIKKYFLSKISFAF